MTQEEKELLLKDLCGRFPYGVKINVKDDAYGLDYDTNLDLVHLAGFGSSESNEMKPYLRPMSSMTEEEEDEYELVCRKSITTQIDWLNKNMFDYRGLIEKGLALEAPESMYNS